MRQISLIIISIFLLSSNSYAKFSTKEEADNFLAKYCIEIVNGINDAYKSQLEAIDKKNWQTFGEKARWIGGLADVYSKICK